LEERLSGLSVLLAGRPLPPDLGERMRAGLFPDPVDAPRIGEALRRLMDLIADGRLPPGKDAGFYIEYLQGRTEISKP
jgi:hypothetical protein